MSETVSLLHSFVPCSVKEAALLLIHDSVMLAVSAGAYAC